MGLVCEKTMHSNVMPGEGTWTVGWPFLWDQELNAWPGTLHAIHTARYHHRIPPGDECYLARLPDGLLQH